MLSTKYQQFFSQTVLGRCTPRGESATSRKKAARLHSFNQSTSMAGGFWWLLMAFDCFWCFFYGFRWLYNSSQSTSMAGWRHFWCLRLLIFRFWADGNTRIPPTNVPRYIWSMCPLWTVCTHTVNILTSLHTHRGNIRNIFSPMTFWSNTGEALRRQPDNYYGLQVSKYKFKYKYCVTFNEQTNTNTNINHSTAILRPAI